MKQLVCVWGPAGWLLLLLCFFSTPSGLVAQSYFNFYRLTVADGLAHNNVYTVYQDRNNYIWIGAGSRLHRFDGTRLLTFQHELGDPNTLGLGNIRCILEDSKGTFWIGTDGGGLSRYKDGKFQTYMATGLPGSLNDNTVEHLIEMPDGSLYLATWGGGINIFRDGVFQYIRHNPNDLNSLSSDNVVDLLYDDQTDMLWIGTWGGGLCFMKDGKLHRFPIDSTGFNSRLARSIARMPDGSIWIGSWGDGLFQYKNGKFTQFLADQPSGNSIQNNNVLSLIPDGNKLWIGTWGGGISLFDGTNFKTFRHNSRDPNSISSDFVECTLIDRSGDLWIGTYGGGVTKFEKTYFTSFQDKYPDESEISSGFVRSILEDNEGRIWMGTANGIDIFDGKKVYPIKKFYQGFDKINSVNSLLKARNGDIWIGGSTGVGLYRFDGEQVHNLTKKYGPDFSQYFISDIAQSRDGAIWISADVEGGLSRIQGDSIVTFLHDPNNPNSLNSSYILYSLETSDGTVWVATSREGLTSYRNGKFTRYRCDEKDPTTISNNYIYSLLETSDGTLWVATESGLNRYNKATDTFERFLSKDGLLDDTILTLVEDDLGFIWIGTHRGISKFDPRVKKFQNFDRRSGITANPFHLGSVLKSARTGEIYMGGINGLLAFHPDTVKQYGFTPTVQITNFLINSQPVAIGESSVLKQPIEQTTRITLDRFKGSLALEYSSMDFGSGPESQYSYWMQGFEHDWNYIGQNRVANYSNLPAGEYTFRVRSSVDGQKWSDSKSLDIVVDPAWWESIWFRVFFVLLFLGIVALLVQWRLRYLEIQKVKLTRMVKRKTRKIKRQNDQILNKSEELTKTNEELREILDELQTAQKQLVESEKLASIGILASGLAHELNNPLNYIGGIVQPIKRDLQDITFMIQPERQKEFADILIEIDTLLDNMQEGTVKATGIVSNLMTITPKRVQPERIVLDICPLIQAIVMKTRKLKPGLSITTNLPGELLVEGDPEELSQLFDNMIKNATEAIPEGRSGKITFEGAVNSGKVEIRISDNGIGIPEEQIHQIFEPFYTTKAPGKGTGLGLFISYTIIKKYRGQIEVASTIGEGSSFSIILPAFLRQP